MSLLPNNTYANPGNSFYGVAGGGGGDSLQSPVDLIPAAGDGSISLTADATGTGNALLSVTSPQIGRINVDGGNAMVTIGEGAGTQPLAIFNNGAGVLSIQSGTTTPLPTTASFDMVNNIVNMANPLAMGSVFLNAQTTVTSSGSRPAPSGITLTPTTATVSNIGQAVAAGGSLLLGSSIANPDTLIVADAAGSGTVAVGGNGGSSIVMTGGAGASQTSIITTSATGVGSLLLGASAANDRTIFINDTAGAANTAVVDITGGTATGVALRLRGYGTGTAATISTNAGAGGVLNIQNNATDIPPNMTLNDASTTINGLVLVPNDLSFVGSGSITAFQTFLTSGVVCGDNTTTGIPNPAGLVIGLYLVLARGTIGGTNSPTCSVSTTAYYNGTGWVWGGGGACPALVSAPPSYIGIQGGSAALVLANGGGLGTVTMDFTYLKLGGNLGI